MAEQGKYSNLTDEELVRLITKEGQASLYAVLYDRFYPRVLDKCYSLLRNRDLADESAEDILSKAYEKLPGFRGNSSFSSWLYSIT